MKLVIMTPFYFPSTGGVQETFRLFAEFFTQQGWTVQVHASQLQGIDDIRISDIRKIRNFMPHQIKDGIEVFRYDGGGITEAFLGFCYSAAYRLKLPLADLLFCKYRLRGMRKAEMLKNIRQFKPDVILVGPCVDFMMNLALSAKKATGARVIVHNALHLDDKRQMGLKAAVEKLKKVDIVQANTEYEKNYLVKQGVSAQKIYTSGPAVDVSHFLAPMDEKRVDGRIRNKLDGKRFVFYLGRKEEGKGVGALIRAVDEARRHFPDLNLVLAGPETGYSKKVIAKAINGKAYVHNFGRLDFASKHWLFQNAVLFSMVSHVDSFGIAYCESWLCRRPVIGADNEQMRCVIHDGETGFLVPYGDSQKIAGVIKTALEDTSKLDRMGHKGYEHVIREFAQQAVEKRMFAAAQSLVSEPVSS